MDGSGAGGSGLTNEVRALIVAILFSAFDLYMIHVASMPLSNECYMYASYVAP